MAVQRNRAAGRWAWALLLALAPACHFDQLGSPASADGGPGDDDGGGDGDAGETDGGGFALGAGEAQVWIGGLAAPTLRARRLPVDGDAWLDDGVAIDVASPRFVIAEPSPTERMELVLVQHDDGASARLTAYAHRDGVLEPQWSEDLGAQTGSHFRAFDVAFEASGNALVVWTDRTQTPHFRSFSAGGWSLAQDLPVNDGVGPLADLNDSTARWVELERGPVGDQIALGYSDDNDRMAAIIWNGADWDQATAHVVTSFLKYNITTLQSENQPFDLAWEALSSDLLIAWGRNDSNGFGWTQRTAADGVWSANVIELSALPDGQAHEAHLATRPGSDEIALALFDLGDGGVERLGLAMWNGGGWQDQAELDPTLRNFDDLGLGRQAGQVAWAGERAVCVYGDEETGTLDWASWSAGSGWTLEPDVEIFGKGLTESLLLAPAREGELAVVIVDDGAGVWALRYDGLAWRPTTPTPLSTDIAGVESMPISLDSR